MSDYESYALRFHDQCRENERLERQLANLKKKIEKLEESEGRLADIVRRSLELRAFVYDHQKAVATGYYIDAKAALEKRPLP